MNELLKIATNNKIKMPNEYQIALDIIKEHLKYEFKTEGKDFIPIRTLLADKCLIKLQELVNKEIPQAPMLEGDGCWDGEIVYDTWVCPNCEKHYEVDYDKYDYCPACGQALEWEDES